MDDARPFCVTVAESDCPIPTPGDCRKNGDRQPIVETIPGQRLRMRLRKPQRSQNADFVDRWVQISSVTIARNTVFQIQPPFLSPAQDGPLINGARRSEKSRTLEGGSRTN